MNDQALLERIVRDPEVMAGKPIIEGTRLTVECVLTLLAHGATEEEILGEYERLQQEDIRACLLFGARSLSEEDPPSSKVDSNAKSEGVSEVYKTLQQANSPEGAETRSIGKMVLRRAEFWTLIAMVVALIVAAVANWFGKEMTTLIFTFVFITVPVVGLLASICQNLWLIVTSRPPIENFLSQASQRQGRRERAAHELSNYLPKTRRDAEEALSMEIERIESEFSLCFGILDKAGFIPAAVVLYVGYWQYVGSSAQSEWGYLLFLGAFLLYLMGVLHGFWRQSPKDLLWLLRVTNEEDLRRAEGAPVEEERGRAE